MAGTIGNQLLAKILGEARTSDFLRLSEEMFVQDETQAFQFVLKHYAQYQVLPSLELAQKKILRGVSTPDTFGYYHDTVLNRSIHNRFDELLPRLQEILHRGDGLVAVDETAKFIEDVSILRGQGHRQLSAMADLVDATLDEALARRMEGGMVGIPTGWPTLDRATGGWCDGDMYIILARPQKGKSLFLLNMAMTAHLEGFIPLFVSMEMRDLQMARRYLALRAKYSDTLLKRGEIGIHGERRLREVAAQVRSEIPFHFIEGAFKSDISDIASLAHSLRPHILFIDGGYLVKSRLTSNQAKNWEVMSEVAQGIKQIGGRLRIPTVVTFQFTRSLPKVKKKGSADSQNPARGGGGFEHVQLSDAISQLASVGIGIYDDDDFEVGGDDRRRYVEFLGGREGERGGFTINWDWDRMDFREIPKYG